MMVLNWDWRGNHHGFQVRTKVSHCGFSSFFFLLDGGCWMDMYTFTLIEG